MAIRIISIEDEDEINELLRVVLDSPQIEVLTCRTAAEGLDAVHQYQPDLVLLDIMLPDMDGWIVYDAIRSDAELAQTPIVMLTALRKEFQPRRSYRAGPIDTYLTKPFDMMNLRRQVQLLLNVQLW
jgi:DNA-binding response OmpR family regulator